MYRSLAVAALLACAPAAGAGPYDDLLKHSSANTNALVLIDVKAAAASPLAKRDKWAEKVQQSGHGGLGFFPPDADLVAIAGEVNFTTMSRDFQVGLVKVKGLPNFKTLAAQEGGTTDEIAGQLTVVSPREVYFTSFPGETLAAVYPADRQYVSRWLKAHRGGKLPPLVPYLKTAADAAGGDTVTIALDLEDVLEPALLRYGLSVSPVLVKHKGVNQSALAAFLSRVKGLTFSAKVTDAVAGKLVVDFPEDVNRYKGVLKDLFLEMIDGYGVSLAGLEKWEATFTDKTMTLSGPLSGDDLRRIVSLFAFPRPEGTDAPAAPGDAPSAGATQRYLRAADAILTDIKYVKDSSDYGKTATWHDKAAAQLEQLSRRNVDPAAVDAAHQAAQGLRAIAASLRGVPVDVTAAASKGYSYTQWGVYPNWGWPHYGGWWGGYRGAIVAPQGVQTNLPQVQGEMAKVVADDHKRRIATWSKIDQTMSDARRKLGEKYKTDF
ncbi:hypothetical protein GobsT_72600 [Gemmata obscuriglobus]|uniref:Uncharacterized protein n=1 Tax=Gemmata obscuriglobus TaxID=114 RepID=A0A2Z3H4F0_9BACT|nr:hypothetical protein [Gemmata obscuriglobus]AWM41659.1 hypothetical protein C1280_34790 [Gemmata obscuriglobus]QEG32405.1 hypothetical protein GobsT_72600 [Gemmata obscuriglobus]VTS11761.1 Uncharacterized protein OS=Pirellula staleyi (strain ATCC 27377 / DSM 6068 / ICPB 4128) GN=Psta_1474 PE=4 SV=1 [Gemmata obscuriglobus UQM 2246]